MQSIAIGTNAPEVGEKTKLGGDGSRECLTKEEESFCPPKSLANSLVFLTFIKKFCAENLSNSLVSLTFIKKVSTNFLGIFQHTFARESHLDCYFLKEFFIVTNSRKLPQHFEEVLGA